MPRIPPSLKWMIDKRGRIDGDIQRIEGYLKKHQREFEKFQKLTNELSELRGTLASIDKALSLHEIQISPENIPTIRGRKNKNDLPYGELTRLIYTILSLSYGQPISSKEIVDFVFKRRMKLNLSDAVRPY
ncbi:MAG: hypothetical protein H6R01_238 [Burkholderiaceae bacterium]|nr:hypothetical protein [Burkholderiaceae bacterium]